MSAKLSSTMLVIIRRIGKRLKPEIGSRDFRKQRFSSRGGPIHWHKNPLRLFIVIVYCVASRSSGNGFLWWEPKASAVASAFVPFPSTKHPPLTTSQRSNRIQRRQILARKRTRITILSESIRSVSGVDHADNESGDDLVGWRSNLPRDGYASPLLWESRDDWKSFMTQFNSGTGPMKNKEVGTGDHLWEQVKLEALTQLSTEPEAGPQLYQNILSQGSLVEAIVSIIAHEVQSDLVTATEIKQLFLNSLTEEDEHSIRCDVIAAATRSPSVELAVLAILFHTGLHALVCYRVGHRLWKADRTGLAKYLQSTVSGHYSADIHPACSMGEGIYLCTAAGVVIGETATVGNDVSILHGVTLGGTGKELGDRHPKVQHGVILKDCATVLGNIPVGTGAVVMAKAIVNKPVPPLAIMGGVPAKVIENRTLSREAFRDDLEEHLAFKYLDEWRELQQKTID